MTRQTSANDQVNVQAEKVDAFGERVAIAINRVGGSTKMAEIAGVSTSVLSKWRRGESDPSRSRLIKMASAAGISLEWLATGEGPMVRKDLSEEKIAEPEVGRIKEDARMHYAGSETALSKADTILEAHRARKDKAEKQYWQQSLPASFYARLVPALGKHTTDTKTIERILERVISMVMALTVDLSTWPEHLSDEHLEQLVAIAAAAIHRHDKSHIDDFSW